MEALKGETDALSQELETLKKRGFFRLVVNGEMIDLPDGGVDQCAIQVKEDGLTIQRKHENDLFYPSDTGWNFKASAVNRCSGSHGW